MVLEGFPESVGNSVARAATQAQTSVSLQDLMRTGQGEYLHRTFQDDLDNDHTATELVLIQVAGFLRREMPVRLAHRIQDLERVPLMKDAKSVRDVRDLYITSFQELEAFDPLIRTPQEEEDFSKLLENIYERHSKVLVQMARGAYECRDLIRTQKDLEFELMEETHNFLDRFYLYRIGMRVLIGQYLALRQPPVENYIGIVCSHTSPYEIVKRAIDDAAFMCTRMYGDAPEVIMSGRLDLTFPYVPTHLHYIMLELLKNSMRATVEWHGVDAEFPPIKVIIADGNDNEDVVIKVSDEGGGIPRSNTKKIWSYLFTTADPSIQENVVGDNPDHSTDSPLAGLGYGLPISRSYCRYFGGDLSIMSMEGEFCHVIHIRVRRILVGAYYGWLTLSLDSTRLTRWIASGYGTDAFVYLARLGNTREPLPI
ncbi:oxobutanoate dehydrogenase [lipoamide] kinase, mitochondrial [Seminavis robusta]|uniref:Protein-serine/threonine kinase n=1 Tax=Seminavis robusta TaxID=568900 RepID=A0A9N8GZD4_9STRA|nr:oxobutanoate dehydrogenase [lipoamide] kinase, mitochondrial [Seminavis robusta]|eukprot:Sro2_g001840.1 oxobutanoate dehydrogenase [lipoamide]] kinase, mitochondrial (426) ;mRNA; f:258756-260126